MFPLVRERTRELVAEAVDRAVEFATLGEYGFTAEGGEVDYASPMPGAARRGGAPPRCTSAAVERQPAAALSSARARREARETSGWALGSSPRSRRRSRRSEGRGGGPGTG